MDYYQIGVANDITKDYISAAYYYELAVSEDTNADAFVDLALLYFQFTDYGMNASSGLSLDFIHTAFERYPLIIEKGLINYPSNTEMIFWEAYFRHRTIYDDLTSNDVLKILNTGEPSVVPYFFLWILEPKKYEVQREKLLKICNISLTSKNRWILSLIDTPAIDSSLN